MPHGWFTYPAPVWARRASAVTSAESIARACTWCLRCMRMPTPAMAWAIAIAMAWAWAGEGAELAAYLDLRIYVYICERVSV